MKRLAYSLIGVGCLGIISLTTWLKNPFTSSANDPLGPPPEPVEIWLSVAFITCLICFSIAGWLLSGTSVPREGIPHRFIMTFVAGVFGTLAAAGLTFSIFGLRAWLFPAPPPLSINEGR